MIAVMRRWLGAVALSASLSSGCPSESSFECGSDGDCGTNGRCEPTGFCSFPDAGCASGYRYGDLAESLSNQCVIEEPGTTSAATGEADTSSSGTPQPSTSGAGSTGPTSTSDASGSTHGEESTQGTGDTTSSGGSTGGPECTALEFDELPGPPEWFVYSESATPPSVQGGELVLPVDVMGASTTIAGVRANTPRDLSSNARVLTVVTDVPSLPQVTSGLAINDEIVDNPASVSFRIMAGVLRVQRFEDGVVETLAERPIGPADLPLTLEVVVMADEAIYIATGPDFQDEMFAAEAPAWFSDAYVSIEAGNVSNMQPDGAPRFDRLEVCL